MSEVKCYYCIFCTGAHFEHLLSDTVIRLFTCEEKRIKLAVQTFPVKLSGWYEWYLCVWCVFRGENKTQIMGGNTLHNFHTWIWKTGK